MNRREFLSHIPSYAAVPAVLSLPVSRAQSNPSPAPDWIKKLERHYQSAKRHPEFGKWWNTSGLFFQITEDDIVRRVYHRWREVVGCVNATAIGIFDAETILISEHYSSVPSATFHIRPHSQNLIRISSGGLCRITDKFGGPLRKSIDFYSL